MDVFKEIKPTNKQTMHFKLANGLRYCQWGLLYLNPSIHPPLYNNIPNPPSCASTGSVMDCNKRCNEFVTCLWMVNKTAKSRPNFMRNFIRVIRRWSEECTSITHVIQLQAKSLQICNSYEEMWRIKDTAAEEMHFFSLSASIIIITNRLVTPSSPLLLIPPSSDQHLIEWLSGLCSNTGSSFRLCEIE